VAFNNGNPHSSEHAMGWAANEAVEKAKTQVASYINSLEDEIICTSGSTESNNLAIIGLGYAALDTSKKKDYFNILY
jgi:cysteine desulfurase